MEAVTKILCDTNVIIELFKGNQATQSDLLNIGPQNIVISSVTLMELVVGAFNKAELHQIKKSLSSIKIIQINELISQEAVTLITKYSKSHNLLIPDALIGATALVHDIPLFTYNLKDFRYIDNLMLHSSTGI